MGKNGRRRLLTLLCMGLLAFLGMPQREIRAQEPQHTVQTQEDGAWEKQPGTGRTAMQQETEDVLYLAAWQDMADTFAAQSASFWQAKETELAAAGQAQAASFAAEKGAEGAAWSAALQEALDRLAAAASQADAVRLAARQEVERDFAAMTAWFTEAAGQLSALQESGAAGTAGVQPGLTGAQQGTEDQPQLPATFLAGKKVSILGDSITTFRGYIPEGYTCYYPREGNDLTDVEDTWWRKVIDRTGMQLLVNGAYSGSAVCGDSRAEDSSAGCSNRRLVELMGADGTVPDVILVYLGANDFFHPMELGTWSGQASHRTDHYILDFTEAYELMLQKLQMIYPDTRIYCMTLIEANSEDHPRVNANGNTIADFNRRIKEIAAARGIPVIDVHECGMPVYELNRYTSDGTHPNKEGAEKMASYVTGALLQDPWSV